MCFIQAVERKAIQEQQNLEIIVLKEVDTLLCCDVICTMIQSQWLSVCSANRCLLPYRAGWEFFIETGFELIMLDLSEFSNLIFLKKLKYAMTFLSFVKGHKNILVKVLFSFLVSLFFFFLNTKIFLAFFAIKTWDWFMLKSTKVMCLVWKIR